MALSSSTTRSPGRAARASLTRLAERSTRWKRLTQPTQRSTNMQLKAVYFLPGVHVTCRVPGYPTSLSFWDAEKYPKLKCEEQKNGDVWLTSEDGFRREVSALVIAWRLRVPSEQAK